MLPMATFWVGRPAGALRDMPSSVAASVSAAPFPAFSDGLSGLSAVVSLAKVAAASAAQARA